MTDELARAEWLEEGETILWTGRPRAGLELLRTVGPFLVVLAIGGALLWRAVQVGGLEQYRHLLEDQVTQGVVAVLFFLSIPVIVLVRASRTRYFLTDRRVALGSSGGSLRWSLAPESVVRLDRVGPGGIDLRFARRRRRSGSNEEGWKSFRSVPRADEVSDRIGEWLGAHDDALLEEVEARRPVVSDAGGYSVEMPEAWEVRTYRTRHPDEAGALQPGDPAASRSLEADEDWNVVVGRGSGAMAVTVESYPGQPPEEPELEGAMKFLADTVVPDALEEEEASVGGAQGRRIRREFRGLGRLGREGGEVAMFVDQWTLTSDDRWYRLIASWARSLPSGENAVRQVVQTFRAAASGS